MFVSLSPETSSRGSAPEGNQVLFLHDVNTTANPYSPALQSSPPTPPLALSGASRRKQIPCSAESKFLAAIRCLIIDHP